MTIRYLIRTIIWSLIIGAGFLGFTATQIRPDPTDDFSITLEWTASAADYHLISEDQVIEILIDHLDLFPQSQIPRLAHHITNLCEQFRFDPAFVLSLIKVESGFRVKAISRSGAVGLMQLLPDTAALVARQYTIPYHGDRALVDPFTNITIGITYLAALRDHYAGFPPHFLAAYNVGPAKMDEFLIQKDFKPVQTKQYYELIRRHIPQLRFYGEKRQYGV